MIRSFRDKRSANLFLGNRSRSVPPELAQRARRKMRILDQARSLDDLRVPAGNRLEALRGNRDGQYSIRINDQWRICFLWREGDAHEVEIVDYH